ncbi:hypothetical protein JCM19233_2652 [Vibrio astriarenae]|nr:hypothetical protein JCM19233_2652 [Vibrio sp. C7]
MLSHGTPFTQNMCNFLWLDKTKRLMLSIKPLENKCQSTGLDLFEDQ